MHGLGFSACVSWMMKSPRWRIVLGEESGRFMNENFLTHENVEV